MRRNQGEKLLVINGTEISQTRFDDGNCSSGGNERDGGRRASDDNGTGRERLCGNERVTFFGCLWSRRDGNGRRPRSPLQNEESEQGQGNKNSGDISHAANAVTTANDAERFVEQGFAKTGGRSLGQNVVEQFVVSLSIH